MKQIFIILMVLMSIAAAGQAAAGNNRKSDAARLEQLYNEANSHLNQGQWQDALDLLTQLYAAGGHRADAALYWKAYALDKLGKETDAAAALTELLRAFPQSSWQKDAIALQMELKQQMGEIPEAPEDADDDIKMLALNSLIRTDPERAIPMLQGLLDAKQPAKVRRRALFVLAQSDSPKAKQILLDSARTQTQPELQMEAIRFLGVFHGKQHLDVLSQIYSGTQDKRVKESVLTAFLTSGAKDRVLAIARQEQDPHVRRHAIRTLGMMGGGPELQQLLQASSSEEDSEATMQAMAMSGNLAGIEQMAKTSTNPAVRRRAVRTLGIFGGEKIRASLLEIYGGSTDQEVRRSVVQTLFITGGAKELVELARKENDPAMKKHIVRQLSLMNTKEARDYMVELLGK